MVLPSKPISTGCRIETLRHKTAERLKRAIAINLVIAWRIMLMTLLGRQCPDLPADVLLSDPEIEVLQAYAKKLQSLCEGLSLRGWTSEDEETYR